MAEIEKSALLLIAYLHGPGSRSMEAEGRLHALTVILASIRNPRAKGTQLYKLADDPGATQEVDWQGADWLRSRGMHIELLNTYVQKNGARFGNYLETCTEMLRRIAGSWR